MSKLNLTIGSTVYYKNQEHTIVRIINFNQAAIQNVKNSEVFTVNINELRSNMIQPSTEKSYIDNYSEDEWQIAKERYEIIRPLIFKNRSRIEVEEIAKQHQKSPTTIYKWINIYEQTQEISSLIPKTAKRGKKGSRLDKKVEHIIQQILEELYLNKQKYGFRKIYSKIARECKKLNLDIPHENTIRNRIEAIHPKQAVKARDGYKASQTQFNNFEGEFPEGNYPLEVLQIDHTPLDIIVVDKIHRQPLGRPYLTLAIDVYSRMIAGFYISLQAPGYYNVSQCLLNSFSEKGNLLQQYNIEGEWNIYGIPRIIHVDNGADLVSNDMQRVCDEFGITLMKRPVARPQFGAHVERFFGTINKEVHNLDGTTFSNIQEKGEYNSQKNASYTLEELTKWLLHYIVNIYHNSYHHGIEMTPNDKYTIGIFGDDENPGTGMLPPIIENIDDIHISLLPTYFRTIQKTGISIDGITYYSDVLRHWIGIKDENGNKIKHKIKRDPLNIQKIYFFDPEVKEYFEVPYRKLYAPVMTLWDLYAVKRYLKEKKITNYSEEDLFEAYEVLERIEQETLNIHKKQKIKKSKPVKNITQTTIHKNNEKENTAASSNYDSLFEDINIFDVALIKAIDED